MEENNSLPQAPGGMPPPTKPSAASATPAVQPTEATSTLVVEPLSTVSPVVQSATPAETKPPVVEPEVKKDPALSSRPALSSEPKVGDPTPSISVASTTPVSAPDSVAPSPSVATDKPAGMAADPHAADMGMKKDTTPTVSATPATGLPMGDKSHKSKMGGDKKKFIVVIIIAAVIAILVAVAAYFALDSISSQNEVAKLEATVAEISATTHPLPDDAFQVSECVPNMGFHYVTKGGDPRFGPFLLVSKQGEIIGYEYMFSDDMFEALPSPEIALEILKDDLGIQDLSGWVYHTIEVSKAPEGHPGFETPHTDIHLYTVPPEVQARACQ